jgi:outer membrane protein TolC
VPVQIKDPLTVETMPQDPSDMKLSLTQPVFTSGKLSNALAIRREEASEAALREAHARAGVDLEIERAFNEVLLADEALALQEEMGKQTGAVLADAEHRFTEQSASRLELLEARSARTRAQMPLLRARQDARNQLQRLEHIVGWEEDRPLAVSGRLAVVPLRTDPATLVDRALADRPDLRVLAQELTVKERELRAVQLTNTPSVSLVGNYEFWQRARSDLPENVWSGGVAFNWPIFEGATLLPRLQAARLALEEVTLRQRQLRASIDLEVTRAVSDLQVAADAHQTQQADLETAGERVRMAKAGLETGTTPPVELIRSQMQLLDARLVEADLRFQHAIARARLEYVVGAPPGGLEP